MPHNINSNFQSLSVTKRLFLSEIYLATRFFARKRAREKCPVGGEKGRKNRPHNFPNILEHETKQQFLFGHEFPHFCTCGETLVTLILHKQSYGQSRRGNACFLGRARAETKRVFWVDFDLPVFNEVWHAVLWRYR